MVTTPVLSVSPAGMVRIVFPVSVVVSVGFTDTVTVVAALDADGMLAVTVLAFPVPLSLIVAGVSARATFPAAASSSVIVSVTSSGSVTPTLFTAVPRRHRRCPPPGWSHPVPCSDVGRTPTLFTAVVHRRDGHHPRAVGVPRRDGQDRVPGQRRGVRRVHRHRDRRGRAGRRRYARRNRARIPRPALVDRRRRQRQGHLPRRRVVVGDRQRHVVRSVTPTLFTAVPLTATIRFPCRRRRSPP